MNVLFNVQQSELNSQFLSTIKALFKGSRLSIAISDEKATDYFYSTSTNRKSTEQVLDSKEGYRFTPDEFKKFSADLLAGKKPDLSLLKKVKLSA